MKIASFWKSVILQALLVLSSICLHAQTTTGVWKGTLHSDATKQDIPCEIIITEKNGFVRGYSYVSYNGQPPVLKKIKILFRDKNIALEDLSPVLEDTVFSELQKTNITYATAITSPGEINGIWKTVKTKSDKNNSGSLALEKVDDFRETEIFKQLDSLNLAKDLSFNKKREPEIEIIDLAKLSSDSVFKSPLDENELRKNPDTITLVAKVPSIPIKEAFAAIKEKKIDTPLVVIVEKKSPPPVVITKPVEEKKPPKTIAVTKPVIEKKPPLVIAKVEPKKEITSIKKEPAPVVKHPVTAPPPTVAVVIKKPEPPPTVVKKELPVQVFAPPDKDVAADVTNRKTSAVQSVEYQSDSLILTLYDNGEIDGDTVSVLMNGKAIFSKAGLSTRPNRKTIYITPEMPDSLTLVMYAENLGSIPPNTGLLVVGDGDKVYELRFSADLKTNAAIIFRRKRQ